MQSRSLLVCLLAACFSAYSYSSDLTDLRGDSAATEHYITDDGYASVPLDFEYPFYGRTFTHSWMFSNGVIGFLEPSTSFCCTGYDVSDSFYGSKISFTLMPLQTDLENYNGQFLTKGDENSMTYGWYNISEYGRPNSSNTFEAEIFADGMYEFRYGELDVARSVTIASVGNPSIEQYDIHHTGVLPPNGMETITAYGLNGLCKLDPLIDPNCPGYAEAFAQIQYEQNCFADPLYDQGCPRYADAFLEQQCDRDPTYSASCEGYANAMDEQDRQSDSATTVSALAEPAITGDQTVDEILRESSDQRTENTDYAPAQPIQADQEQADNSEDSRREKMREIAIDEAKDLASTMSVAATIEQQQAMQARVMSLISYVPGFSAYANVGIPQPSRYYEPREIYVNLTIPDSNRGARVGLAQEILHNRMVDMQYGDE